MAMAPCAPAAITFPARPAVQLRATAAAGVVRAGAEGGKWWAPLLGWSGRCDYLGAPAPVLAQAEEIENKAAAAGRNRAFVGSLTEEKARELRARMAGTESFHDAMYHSAIASRLARSA
ncbi:uncharacterized protein LOC133929688 [Phragmites australis]|uniref:uncharacterized protein LOC133929688 n=1 Tax=Phragmites australis TaxID=29695 RepID=UPI002D772EBA|nr:uncharacterized protein LOC133929688 [Phragmites australis]